MSLTCARYQDGSIENMAKFVDEDLVELAKSGIDVAYLELCKRHESMIRMMVLRIMQSREDCEDVLQDTFLSGYLHIARFEGRSKFSTWLGRIAINTALMARRKARNRPTQSLEGFEDDSFSFVATLAHPSPDPEAQTLRREELRLLHMAVQRLPQRLRVAIEMRHTGELSTQEVATRLGISLSAAKSRLNRARCELITCVSTTRDRSIRL